MKSRRFFIFIVIAAMVAVVFSCKKKDKTTAPASKYFSGKLKFSVPAFVKKGQSCTMVPYGVYRKDKGDFGYFWKVTPKLSVKDTVKFEGKTGNGSYTFVIPDTLCTLTVSCSAFAKGYYNSTGVAYVTIVDAEKSLEIPGFAGLAAETDARDGKKYAYTVVGDIRWMARNLAFEGAGKPYGSAVATTDVFGMYYTGAEAASVCPSGWRLPSVADWKALCGSVSGKTGDEAFTGTAGGLMSDAYFNKTRLWEFWPEVKITNKSGFSAIPTGYASVRTSGYAFHGFKAYSAYWASDVTSDGQGQYVYIYKERPDVMVGSADKASFAASVRCIKNN